MTTDSPQPLVGLQPEGKATILSYNVPEPTMYSGRNYIDLFFEAGTFKEEVAKAPARPDLTKLPFSQLVGSVRTSLATGVLDPDLFPAASRRAGAATLVQRAVSARATSLAHSPLAASAIAGVAKRPRTSPASTSKGRNPTTGEVVDPVDEAEDAVDQAGGDQAGGGSGSGDSGGGSGGGGRGGDQDGATSIATNLAEGLTPSLIDTLWGDTVVVWTPMPTVAEPRLVLVEEYRLSTYLGSFGAGRVVQTMSLLPGEKTTISVKSYLQSSTTAAQASSVLDSFSEDSASDFESSIQSEQSDQSSYSKNSEYHADASASASWGWGSASVSGGVSGGTNSTREEFAKNVAAATEKHSMSASAKREVQVDTSSEVTTESGSETAITREISNINVSRPLNFVFRQMDQEFVTILHLVDVRVAFFNNYAESKRERTLPELDALIDEVVVDKVATRKAVHDQVIHALRSITDHHGDQIGDFIRTRSYPEMDGSKTTVWQVNRDRVSVYDDPATGAQFTVPGVIMAVQKNTMRTDGLIVETIMGLAPALDEYNEQLQAESLHERQAQNLALDLGNAREQLAQQIVASGNAAQLKAFTAIFAPDAETEPAPS